MFPSVVLMLIIHIQAVFPIETDSYFKREIKYSSNKLSWSGAFSTCVENKDQLITVNDNITVNALIHMFNLAETDSMIGHLWTGLHDIVSGSNPEFQWANCDPIGNFSTVNDDEDGAEVGRCVAARRKEISLVTKPCNKTHVFACEEDMGSCSYSKQGDTVCISADPSSRVILEGEFDDKKCKARCTVDTRNSEVCWAYERHTKTKVCTLLFGSDPFMCENTESMKDTDLGRRLCFVFSDITGSKEQTIDSIHPISNCVLTTVSPPSTSTPTLTSTSAVVTTTTTSSESIGTTSAAGTTATGTSITAIPSTTTTDASEATTTTSPDATTTTTETDVSAATTTTTTTDATTTSTQAGFSTTDMVTTTSTTDVDDETTERSDAPNNPTTTSLSATPAVTSPARTVSTMCVKVKFFTPAQRQKRTEDIVEDLTLDRKNLSSYLRTKSSAEDERASAQNLGGLGIAMLVISTLLIIVPDCITLGLKISQTIKNKLS